MLSTGASHQNMHTVATTFTFHSTCNQPAFIAPVPTPSYAPRILHYGPSCAPPAVTPRDAGSIPQSQGRFSKCHPPQSLRWHASSGIQARGLRRGGLVPLRSQDRTDPIVRSPRTPGVLQRMRGALERADIGLVPTAVFLAQAALIGLLTGLSIITFKTLISWMETYTYGNFLTAALEAFGPKRNPLSYAMALIPAMGGVLVSVIRELAHDFTPGLSGHISEVELKRPLNLKAGVLKSLSAVATLGTGCSLGPEGPAVEIGAVCSRVVTGNLVTEQQKQLLSAGAAAGVAAGFNAPIAGVFFALEISQVGSFESSGGGGGLQKVTLAGITLAAVVSALVARVGLREELALRPAPYILENALVELPAYLGLGVLSGIVALAFKFFLAKSDDFFKGRTHVAAIDKFMSTVPRFAKPIIGGAVCGLVGIVFPQVLFFGYETLDGLIANHSYPASLLLTLLTLKAMMTAFCAGSGLVGGIFAPSLFLGATAGAAYQKLVSAILPGSALLTIAAPPAYAMVGAASVLASMFRAPLTGSLLLFELTRDYDILLPLMASAGVGSLLVELVERKRMASEAAAAAAAAASASAMNEGGDASGERPSSSADEQVIDQIEALLKNDEKEGRSQPAIATEGAFVMDRMERLLYDVKTREAMVPNPLVLPPNTPLEDALLTACATRADVVVVSNGPLPTARLYGVASMRDLTAALEKWYQKELDSRIRRERGSSRAAHEKLAAALEGVPPTADAIEKAAVVGDVLRQLGITTGVTLRQACAPVPGATVRAEEPAVKARDLLTTRGLELLPVVHGPSATQEYVGVVDVASLRAAVGRQETVEMVSRSVLGLGLEREVGVGPAVARKQREKAL